MSTPKPNLSALLPPIILGGGAYNTQMNKDPSSLPIRELISKAFSLGINAIDTSPYYGPSESLIGDAMSHPSITETYSRDSYLLLTKAGRIAEREFNYSPTWIRSSVQRSCKRLCTSYLDVVFCHDVEFVTPEEAIAAVACLFKLVDEGVVRYVGISGYPHTLLTELAARIRVELGRPLDAVQSYCHFNLQNSTLSQSVERLVGSGGAGVDVVLNASPLGMGLLSGRPPGEFHPAPGKLLEACSRAEEFCRGKGETLSRVAMRWVFAKWKGPTISGASYVDELEENVEAYWDVIGYNGGAGGRVSWGVVGGQRLERWEPLWEGVRGILGEWRDYSWDSPPKGWDFKQTEKDGGM